MNVECAVRGCEEPAVESVMRLAFEGEWIAVWYCARDAEAVIAELARAGAL